MKRTVTIEIDGRAWPMCLTLRAFCEICDQYGSLPDCLKKLDEMVSAADNKGLIDNYLWLLDKLLWSMVLYQDENYDDLPPTIQDMKEIFSPGDIPYIQRKVLECIQIGQTREVGVAPPKNGDGGAAAAPVS